MNNHLQRTFNNEIYDLYKFAKIKARQKNVHAFIFFQSNIYYNNEDRGKVKLNYYVFELYN